jgi:hypothetical protein
MRLAFRLLLLTLLLPVAASAQEVRGNISGTIRDNEGVVPGALVKLTNVETNVSQNLVANSSGYYEAPLLNPGTYQVTVQMSGFKTATREAIVLGVGQQLNISFTLEVGTFSEEVKVTAEAPLLDTTTVSSGANFDSRLLEALPMFSNMPIMLSRFSSGVNPNDQQQQVSQGNVDNTNLAAGTALGNVNNATGSNNYSIDGAANNSTNRRLAISPNADVVQEMRVESSNFDASVGHGSGLQISMMTRAGTNTARGTVHYQHWTNRLNAMTAQQKATFDDFGKSEFEKGRSHNISFTHGAPIHIPKLVDGRGRLFYFANYSHTNDSIPGKLQGQITVPANAKHLQGDFSDLLLLPNPAQYQIYDPLTTRPDPSNPNRMIRSPFAGNIIPRNRIFNQDGSYKNPFMNFYSQMVPSPNQNFVENGQQPTGNFYLGGQPDILKSNLLGGRLDYTASENNRFFLRATGLTSLAYLSDWAWMAADPALRIQSVDRSRYQWSLIGNWTHLIGATVIDLQFATNTFNQIDKFLGLSKFKPTDVGLPAYVDEFCQAEGGCMMPLATIAGYQGMGGNASNGDTATHIQGQSTMTSVRGAHTFRAGIDVRHAARDRTGGGARSSQLAFDRTYTRQASDETQLTPSNLGLSLAAFELGLPTQAAIVNPTPAVYGNAYVGVFGQDTWRIGRLTVNTGLRFEFENGVRERDDRMIVGFDPTARLSITDAAQNAYLASGLQNQAGMYPAISVVGGPLYATTPGQSDESWKGQPLWMPRVSAAYLLGTRTVLKGGYGVYYDVLTAADFDGNQTGYDVTTTSTISDDLGRTFKWGNPATGAAGFDPFPVRADGNRFDTPIGDSLGVDTLLGQSFNNVENRDREHVRQQRWRVSVQRELLPSLSLEIGYQGTFSDHVSIAIRQDYLPEPYWNGSNERNTTAQTFLNAQVTNPFRISNFEALRTSSPTLYQRMSGQATFSSNTIQRHRLLRAFPQMTGVQYNNLPLGEVKAHSVEFILSHRYSRGLSGNVIFSMNRVTQNRIVEEYDREPTLWQTSNGARPYRVVTVGVYELPFGPGRQFLNSGGFWAALAANWQLSGSWEYQPGALLDWGNLFFYGNLDDIALENPTRERWINTDAGFEKDPARTPAAFQKRTFPFRVEGVRGMDLMFTNMSLLRSFDLGSRRTLQFRVDAQNLFNRQQWLGPNLNPTSTEFGRVSTVALNQMRFFTFSTRLTF